MSSSKDDRPFLFRWREAFCSESGPRSPTTRAVLQVLSTHMKKDGSSCYPSQSTIAREARLSVKAVKIHLKRAEETGWISRALRSRGAIQSQRYGTLYEPLIPVCLAEGSPTPPNEIFGERRTPILGNVVPALGNVVPALGNDVPTSSSGSASKSASGSDPGAARPKGPAGAGAEPGAIDAYTASRKRTSTTAERCSDAMPSQQSAPASPVQRGGGGPLELHARPRPAPSRPALRRGSGQQGAEGVKRGAVQRARNKNTPSELELIAAWIQVLTAEGAMTERAAKASIKAVLRHKGEEFVRDVLHQCEQEGLRGERARERLVGQSAVFDWRQAQKQRGYEALALKMAELLERLFGLRVSDAGLSFWPERIRCMCEDDDRQLSEIESVFERAIGDEDLRPKALNPGLLRLHWAELTSALESVAAAP